MPPPPAAPEDNFADAHASAVFEAGFKSGIFGLALGLGGVAAASRRYPSFRGLTLPFKAFLVTSSGTAFAIIAADHKSIDFERQSNPKKRGYEDETARVREEALRNASALDRFLEWGRQNRYRIVFGSWLLGMGASWHWVGRSKYLSLAQRVVQARVYAQALTLAVLVATAAFEVNDAHKGTGRWETVLVVDPEDPTGKRLVEKRIQKETYAGQNQWMDMVAAEEKRMSDRQKRHE